MVENYLFALVVTFGLLAALAWLAARWQRSGGRLQGLWPRAGTDAGYELEVLERLMLTPSHTLLRVRVRGLEQVLVAHPAGVVVLDGVNLKKDKARG